MIRNTTEVQYLWGYTGEILLFLVHFELVYQNI